MSDDWRDLLERVLDGDELSSDETRALSTALDTAANRQEAAKMLRFGTLVASEFSDDATASRERLLAKVVLREKRAELRRRAWRPWLAAAAVLLVAVGVGWYFLANRYPAPVIKGDYRLTDNRIVAGPEGARVNLGGYCDLTLEPGAEIVLTGTPENESVSLNHGTVHSRITPKRGHYRVDTPLGSLDVVGTEFTTTVKRDDVAAVARQFMAALLGSDIATLNRLAVEPPPAWVGPNLREWCASAAEAYGDRATRATEITETLADGEYTALRLGRFDNRGDPRDVFLVLRRTPEGWRVMQIDSGRVKEPLADLLKKTAHPTPFQEVLAAAGAGKIDDVKAILDRNPDVVRAVDDEGETLLYRLAGLEHPTFLGSDIVGPTPPELAEVRARIAELLLDRGAPVDALGRSGMTALQYAGLGAQVGIVRVLVAHKADVSFHSKEHAGHTALHMACGSELRTPEHRLETVRLLLTAGADPLIESMPGRPWSERPLDLALSKAKDNPDLAELVRGAAKPLIEAKRQEVQPVVKRLLEAIQDGDDEALADLTLKDPEAESWERTAANLRNAYAKHLERLTDVSWLVVRNEWAMAALTGPLGDPRPAEAPTIYLMTCPDGRWRGVFCRNEWRADASEEEISRWLYERCILPFGQIRARAFEAAGVKPDRTATRAGEFAREVAARFAARLGQESYDWLNEAKLKRIEKEVAAVAAQVDFSKVTDADRAEILKAVDRYVPDNFRWLDDPMYAVQVSEVSFPNALKTFEAKLYHALKRRPLTAEESARREVQRQWMRENVAFDERDRAAKAAELDAWLADPLWPFAHEPMTDAQFEAFKAAFLAGDEGALRLLYEALKAQYPPSAERGRFSFAMPFEDKITGFGYGRRGMLGHFDFRFQSTTAATGFAVYLVDIPGEAGKREQTPLDELQLAEKPLFTQDDVEHYDWRTHTVKFKPGTKLVLTAGRIQTSVRYFVVTAGGERCYLGAFVGLTASTHPGVPTGTLGEGIAGFHRDLELTPAQMSIGAGRRVDPDSGKVTPPPMDVRNDERIRKALEPSGKLDEGIDPLTAEARTRAEALIAQFSDRQFAVRQKAVDELVKMGPAVLPLVRKTLAETKDTEVKMRCGMVIKGLGADPDEDARRRVAAEPKPGIHLRYEVVVKTHTVKSGGSLQLQARLYNDGDQAVSIPWGHTAYDDMFLFTVTGPDGKVLAAPSGRLTPPVATSPEQFRQLKSGEVLTYDLFLGGLGGRNVQEWYFRKPGRHALSAEYTVKMESLSDPETGRVAKVPDVWTGFLKAQPADFVVEDSPGDHDIAISGKVVDEKGKVISGAVIVVRPVRPNQGMGTRGNDGSYDEPVDRCRSGEDGTFAFESLPNEAVLFSLVGRHDDYPLKKVAVPNEPPKNNYDVTIELVRGVEVKGKVTDSDGQPLAAVSVRSYPADKAVYTDMNGRFRMTGVPANNLRFQFWAPAYSSADEKVDAGAAGTGDWTVKLTHKTRLTFKGTIRQANGRPLSDRKLDFHLKDADGRIDYVRCATDAGGRYEAALNRDSTFAGEVWAEDATWSTVVNNRFHPELKRRWRAAVEGVAPSKTVDVLLRNEGTISTDVQPANELPGGLRIAVILHMACPPDGRWEQADATVLPSTGGKVEFGQLSPGRYKVRAFFATAEGIGWEQTISLGDKDERLQGKLTFLLPRMEFGGLRAEIVDADGNPVPKAIAWFGCGGMNGSLEVIDGLVEVSDIPVGRAWLDCRWGDAYGRLEGQLRSGEVTDIGKLVLRPRRDRQVSVSGRVLYDDGTPVMGAVLEPGGPVKADGSFAATLWKDLPTRISLLSAPGWWGEEAIDGVGLLIGRPVPYNQYSVESVILALDDKAKQPIRRDVVVDRKDRRVVRVVWRGAMPKEPRFSVIVEGDGQFYVRAGVAALKEANVLVLPKLPNGRGVFVLAANDYCGYAAIEPGAQEVPFDRANSGSLVGQATRPDGAPAARVGVILYPAVSNFGDTPWVPLRSITPLTMGISATAGNDGSFHFDSLAPGKYLLKTYVDEEPPVEAEVMLGKQSRVKLVTTANPDTPPPLRDDAPLWGEAVEGVQVRLRADKVQWKMNETPIFKIDLKSKVARPLPQGPAGPGHEFEVVLDGVEYRYVGVDIRSVVNPTPVDHREDIHLALIGKGWQAVKDGKALELAPGKHTVQVALLFESVVKKDSEGAHRALSNPVEIEIFPDGGVAATVLERREAAKADGPVTVAVSVAEGVVAYRFGDETGKLAAGESRTFGEPSLEPRIINERPVFRGNVDTSAAPADDEVFPDKITINEVTIECHKAEEIRKLGLECEDIPWKDNAARVLIDAMNALRRAPDMDDAFSRAAKDLDFAGCRREADEHFKENERAFDLVKQAGTMARCEFPWPRSTPESGMLFPWLSPGRALGRELIWRSAFDLTQGRGREAVDNCFAAMLLGRWLGKQGPVISWLAGIGVQNEAAQMLHRMVASRGFDEPTLKDIAERLVAVRAQLDDSRRAFHAERLCRAVLLMHSEKGGMDFPEEAREVTPEMEEAQLNTDTTRRNINAAYDFFEAQARRPLWDALKPEDSFEEYVKENAPRWDATTRMLIPSLDKLLVLGGRRLALFEGLEIYVALERFRLAKKSYPKDLAELSPAFLKEALVDPFSGKSWGYRREADGTFTLWSVDEDLKDDGGGPDYVFTSRP